MAVKPKIQFQFDSGAFEFNSRKVKEWIRKVIDLHKKRAGEISIVFCSDTFLRKLNKKYLGHDYYTDILSFPLSDAPQLIEGELYISTERVRENAKTYKQDFEIELLRVIIHGILHFLGYSDSNSSPKKAMRNAEDKALQLYKDELIRNDHYFDQVYDIVRCIPKGKVCTYGAIADYLSLGSARMVGWALNQLKGNVTDVPAHRVINRNGELTGRLMFGENGQRMGRLLKSEGVPVKNHKVQDFEKYFWKPE